MKFFVVLDLLISNIFPVSSIEQYMLKIRHSNKLVIITAIYRTTMENKLASNILLTLSLQDIFLI